MEGYAAEVEGHHEKNDMVRHDQVRRGGVAGKGGGLTSARRHSYRECGSAIMRIGEGAVVG